MARKEKDVVISMPGRDQGKIFHLREMAPIPAEKWATRAIAIVARAGIDIGDIDGIMSLGMAGVAMIGIASLMKCPFEDIEPLLDEMMECVFIKPDQSKPTFFRPIMEDDIEEISTRLFLKGEVFQLITGFSIPGAQSNGTSSPAPVSQSPSSNIPIFPEPSVQFSRSPKTKRPR